jgi:tetratricopeptide (TPR) repeat protein
LITIPPVTHPDLTATHRKEINAEAIQFYYLLGKSFFEKGDRAESLKYFNEFLKLEPDNKEVNEIIKSLNNKSV